MTISIQPKEQEDGTLPYPYHINDKGLVGRQDFWNGNPYSLKGFSKKLTTGKMELLVDDFLKDPEQAVGMYPVFADKEDNWYTHGVAIASVKTK